MRFRRRCLFTVALFAVVLMVSQPVVPLMMAQEGETELRSDADYVYGQSLEFSLRARNLGPVEQVTLYFRPHSAIDSFAVEIPTEPGEQIDAAYTLDLTQTRLPPYSSISYWWELRQPDGGTLRVPERQISYVDDQFSWQWSTRTDPNSGGSISAFWTGSSPNLGDRALDMVGSMLPQLGPLLPLEQITPFNIFIYPSSADLASAMRLAGLDWQPGESYPELGVALLTVVNEGTADQELAEGLSRELVELLLYQAVGEGNAQLPEWLKSGLRVATLPMAPGTLEEEVASAIVADEILSFRELCASMPAEGRQSALAEMQSASLVRFIAATYGPQSVGELITAFSSGEECETAVQTVLNLSLSDLEALWLRSEGVSSKPAMSAVPMASLLVLLLAGLGLTLLLVVRPRRKMR